MVTAAEVGDTSVLPLSLGPRPTSGSIALIEGSSTLCGGDLVLDGRSIRLSQGDSGSCGGFCTPNSIVVFVASGESAN